MTCSRRRCHGFVNMELCRDGCCNAGALNQLLQEEMAKGSNTWPDWAWTKGSLKSNLIVKFDKLDGDRKRLPTMILLEMYANCDRMDVESKLRRMNQAAGIG